MSLQTLEEKVIARLTDNTEMTRKRLRDKVGGTNVPLTEFNKVIAKLKRNGTIQQTMVPTGGRAAESFALLHGNAKSNGTSNGNGETMADKIRATIHAMESKGQFNKKTRLMEVITGLKEQGVNEKEITSGTWSNASRILKTAKTRLAKPKRKSVKRKSVKKSVNLVKGKKSAKKLVKGKKSAIKEPIAKKRVVRRKKKVIPSPTIVTLDRLDSILQLVKSFVPSDGKLRKNIPSQIGGLDRIDCILQFVKSCGGFDPAIVTLNNIQDILGVDMNESVQAVNTIHNLASA